MHYKDCGLKNEKGYEWFWLSVGLRSSKINFGDNIPNL